MLFVTVGGVPGLPNPSKTFEYLRKDCCGSVYPVGIILEVGLYKCGGRRDYRLPNDRTRRAVSHPVPFGSLTLLSSPPC